MCTVPGVGDTTELRLEATALAVEAGVWELTKFPYTRLTAYVAVHPADALEFRCTSTRWTTYRGNGRTAGHSTARGWLTSTQPSSTQNTTQ